MDEFKQCPFCGGEAEIMQTEARTFLYVFCGGCGASGDYRDTAEEAAEAWNRRAERTCHFIPYEVDEDTGFFDCMECDSCGLVTDVSEAVYFNFCPECGAKVQE